MIYMIIFLIATDGTQAYAVKQADMKACEAKAVEMREKVRDIETVTRWAVSCVRMESRAVL